MCCHAVNYKIIGYDIQMVEVELDSNETVIAEAGAMTYLEEGIAFLSSTGSIWIQSMPFSRLAERVLSHSIFSSQDEQ